MSRLRALLPLSQRSSRYGDGYKYARLDEQDGYSGKVRKGHSDKAQRKQKRHLSWTTLVLLIMVLSLATAAALLISGYLFLVRSRQRDAQLTIILRSYAQSRSYSSSGCDSVQNGYQCRPEISHFWYVVSSFTYQIHLLS